MTSKGDGFAGMCEAVDFKDLHQVRFSTTNGRSTKKRFKKSDLSIVEASLRVGGPFWSKTKPARYVTTGTKRCSYLDLNGYCCSSVKLWSVHLGLPKALCFRLYTTL